MKYHPANTRRGYTLIELMVCLSIFSFCAMAASSLMFSTYNTNRAVKSATDATSQAEFALRRMIENVRSATDVLYTDPYTGLLIQTPPDSSSLSYIYIYYVTNDPITLRWQLHEKIQTAGSLTLIQDTAIVDSVSSFSVTTLQATSPKSYQINLILNSSPVITRTVTVTARNL